MSNRVAAVLVFSLTLGLARVLGLHFHMDDADRREGSALAQPGAFETPHHHGEHAEEAGHAQAGDADIDVDDSASAVSKPASPDAHWFLTGLACATLVLLKLQSAPIASPPFRPPRTPSRRSLLPPSQAPPRTA